MNAFRATTKAPVDTTKRPGAQETKNKNHQKPTTPLSENEGDVTWKPGEQTMRPSPWRHHRFSRKPMSFLKDKLRDRATLPNNSLQLSKNSQFDCPTETRHRDISPKKDTKTTNSKTTKNLTCGQILYPPQPQPKTLTTTKKTNFSRRGQKPQLQPKTLAVAKNFSRAFSRAQKL